MAAKSQKVFATLFTLCLCMGAQFRTQNFAIEAPDPAIAQQVGQYAEHWRREKALEWLGQEMPTWSEQCPIQIKITLGGSGGATSFAFDQGRILGMNMQIEGSLDRILVSVLPHEITHTVFAHHFRCPVPRWADEGGSVLSEDDFERQRHDQLVREILNTPNRRCPLRRLFAMTQYPNDVMVLYAQGFSVSEFLVSKSNRQAFLGFIGMGMQNGWDTAVKTFYGYSNVETLEEAWLQSLRQSKQSNSQLTSKQRETRSVLTMNQDKSKNGKPTQPITSVTEPTQQINTPIYRAAPPETPALLPESTKLSIRLGPPRYSNGRTANPSIMPTP